ncbi:L,D-transpeptidase family protein [Pedobacter ureilyticus]|uniref:L,D-transpeptidase family protein n=1 Tax=Pedobacter ureilyticus TaxID=1393051 RepID=A0ABW9JAL3_9SPHI|nr:L,D-transpeptidase family protein [Pedobacter helvus]
MNYPASVQRFYQGKGMKSNWINSNANIAATASAMLILDCVRQFGLERKNYHPDIVNYEMMQEAMNSNLSANMGKKIDFEIFLTDAMISMANHLHYGRFNPIFNREKIESGNSIPFRAEEFLLKVAMDNQLMYAISALQPKMSQYRNLQEYLRLMTGQYTCDSYEVSEQQVRKIAINLERLRWNATDSARYLMINIPSFQLEYVDGDSTTIYRLVVGKPSSPTPLLQGLITQIETAPDWLIPQNIFINELLPQAEKDPLFFVKNHMAVYDTKGKLLLINPKTLRDIRNNPQDFRAKQSSGCDNALGNVVFRFNNRYGVYLHDTPLKQYFARKKRALSHGCIRVEFAVELARKILVADENVAALKSFDITITNGKNQRYPLSSALPIIISYQTIAVRDGLLVDYHDTYQLDSQLMAKMYPLNKSTTVLIKK